MENVLRKPSTARVFFLAQVNFWYDHTRLLSQMAKISVSFTKLWGGGGGFLVGGGGGGLLGTFELGLARNLAVANPGLAVRVVALSLFRSFPSLDLGSVQ